MLGMNQSKKAKLMLFYLWEESPLEDHVFAKRTGDEVKAEFHTMAIGSFRNLSDGISIQRAK